MNKSIQDNQKRETGLERKKKKGKKAAVGAVGAVAVAVKVAV